jgi:OOP family OmpA-OmpF porin
MLGYMSFSDGSGVDAALDYSGGLGLMFNRYVGIETTFGWAATTASDGGEDVRATHVGLDVEYWPLPHHRFNPHVSAGWAEFRYDSDDRPDMEGAYNGWEIATGISMTVRETPFSRLSLHVEARDIMAKFDAPLPGDGLQHNFGVSIGLSWEMGDDSHKDTDGDGIIDKIDICPETVLGVIVDAQGCPIDSDGDAVFDGPDQCANTPMGAVVDSDGCPIDSDGDAIWDGLDQCEDTPTGAVVNSEGCPLDGDLDGVFDGLDQCPTTPPGVIADTDGCPTIDSEDERTLYESKQLVLTSVEFESGKAEIKPGTTTSLELIGTVLKKWPGMVLEIGGHTDDRGSEQKNQEVSQERAQAVVDYLIERYSHITAEMLVAKGYGPIQPIADNATEEGRAQNRRVEVILISGGPQAD